MKTQDTISLGFLFAVAQRSVDSSRSICDRGAFLRFVSLGLRAHEKTVLAAIIDMMAQDQLALGNMRN